MATYTTNFSSWSAFESLLTATNAYKSSSAFALSGADNLNLTGSALINGITGNNGANVFDGSADGLNPDFFQAGSSAQDADDHIIFNASTGALCFDAEGMGDTDQVQFAILAAGSNLAATDFVVAL